MKSSLAIGKEEVDGEVDPNRVEVWEMWIFNLYFGLFSPTSFRKSESINISHMRSFVFNFYTFYFVIIMFGKFFGRPHCQECVHS